MNHTWLLLVLVVGCAAPNGPATPSQEPVKCVPASCCHASECVPTGEAPDCSEIFCSSECVPGTLDCGQAQCEYVDGNCEVVQNE